MSQPSVRVSTLWTPAMLTSLALQADGGDLFRLGDLCEQMIADDRIGELLETLCGEVLSSELTFEKGPRFTSGDAEKAPELDEDWPLGYDDDELTALGKWTLITGVGFGKHESWVESVDGRIVPRLKRWHPKQFAWEQKFGAASIWDRTWKVRDHEGQKTPITAGDGTWVIITRGGEFRPWADGLWRGLSPWWMLKRYAIQDWGVHSEKSSKLVLKSDSEVTSEQRKQLSRYIYDAAKDATIVLPVGFSMELIELTSNTREIYDAQINAANEAFAIAILGQNLSTKVDGGSLAAAKEHADKENKKVRAVAQMLAKGLQQQSLSWWAEYNFGDRALAPYPKWHTEPDEDLAAKAATLKTAGDALVAFNTAGYEMSPEDIEEQLGIKLTKKPPEPVVVDPSQPQPVKAPFGKPAPVKTAPAPKKQAARYLASGDKPETAPGFIAGQVYADALSDKETALASDYLSAFVDRIAVAVEGAGDYESIRGGVLKAFADEEDPDRLVELIEHGILLANLAGRHAVQEDLEPDTGSAEGVAALATEMLRQLRN